MDANSVILISQGRRTVARDVFISYKVEDRDAASRLCDALEKGGVRCWMAPRDIPPGREWADAIVEGILKSKNLVMLLSSHSANAKQISREAELADSHNLRIFTFRLEDVRPPQQLLYFLGNLQWLDGFGGQFDSAVIRLLRAIQNSETGGDDSSYVAGSAQGATASAAAPKMVPAPAATPVADFAPVTADAGRKRSYLIPVAVVGVLGIGGALFFNNHKASETDKGQVREISERFVEAREAGQFDVTWSLMSESYRERTNRDEWDATEAKRTAKHGGLEKIHSQGCEQAGAPWVCVYSLSYKDGERFDNRIEVVKSDETHWAIQGGTIKNGG